MSRIGETTHFPDIKAKKCCQCGRWFYYNRVTKQYCGAACRQRAKRDIPPEDKNPYALNEHEQLSALIAEHKPEAFRLLEKLKAKYGFRSVEMCLDVIVELLE